MNGWILTNGAFANSMSALLKSAGSQFSMLKVVHYSDVTYSVENDLPVKLWIKNEPSELPDFFAFLDDIDEPAIALANQLTKLGSYCYTPMKAKQTAMSKIATNQALAKAGLPIAKTMVINKNADRRLIIDSLGIPLVMKPDKGFGGTGVTLIKTEDELEQALSNINDSDVYLAQEFISESKGRDLRVLMVAHTAVLAIERNAATPDEFRSNIKVGGSASDYELTDEIREFSSKVSKAIGLNFCGLDLLFGKDGFVVGEVNASPGGQANWQEKADVFGLLLKDITAGLKKHKEDSL